MKIKLCQNRISIRRTRVSIICLLFFLSLSSLINAQSNTTALNKWNLYNFTDDAELQRTNVFQMDFDKTNVAWIATASGLIKYDGYNWKRYTTLDGLPSNFVRSVKVVGKDSVWIGTDNGAVFFNGKNFVSSLFKIPERNKNIRRIYHDSQKIIWFCSDSWPMKNTIGGLASLNNNLFSVDTLFNNKYIVTIFQSKEGKYFLITDKGIYTKSSSSWMLIDIPMFDSKDINWTSASIIEHPGYGVLISTGDRIFFNKNNIWRELKNVPEHRYGIALYKSSIIYLRNVGASSGRLEYFNGANTNILSPEIMLPKGYAEGILKDYSGNYWLYGYGLLVMFSPDKYEWQSYASNSASIVIENKGKLFAYGEKKQELDGSNFQLNHIVQNSPVIGYNENSKLLWDNNSIVDLLFNLRIHLPQALLNQKIETVSRSRNRLIILSGRNGKQEIHQYYLSKWRKLALQNNIRILRVESCTAGSDVYVYYKDLSNGREYIGTITAEIDMIAEVPAKYIAKFPGELFIDSRKDIFLYGDIGPVKYSRDSQNWTKVNHLISPNVIKIYEVLDYLWFVCSSAMGGIDGLSRYSFKDSSIVNFQTDMITSFNLSSANELIFGSSNKFYIISEKTFNEPFAITIPIDGKVTAVLKSSDGYLIKLEKKIITFRPVKLNPSSTATIYYNQAADASKVSIKLEGQRKFIPYQLGNNFKYSVKINDSEWSGFSEQNFFSFPRDSLNDGYNRIFVRALDAGLNLQYKPSPHEFVLAGIPLEKKPFFIPALVITSSLLIILSFFAFRSERYFRKMVDIRTNDLIASRDQLKKNESRYIDAQKLGKVGNWEYDLKTGSFWGSEEAKRIFGFGPGQAELSTELVESCIPDRERVHQTLVDLIERGEKYNIEYQVIPLNGDAPRFVHSIAEMMKDEVNIPLKVTGVIQDITEIRKAEESRRESDARFRIAQDMSPDGFTILKPIRDEKNRVIDLEWVYENEAIAKLNGTDPKEVVGKRLLDLFPGHRGTELMKAYQQVAESGEPLTFEQSYRGETITENIWFRLVVVPMSENIAILAQDITERKKFEADLKESEERFRKIFEYAPQGIAMALMPEGRLIKANESFTEMFGYTGSELEKLTFPDIIHPDDRHVYYETVRDIEEGISQKHFAEIRYIKKNGDIMWANRALTKISEADGETTYIMAMIEDITDRKKAENEIEKLNQELELRIVQRTSELGAANKELQSFVYSVSHDLRAPLRSIMGFTEIISKRYKDNLNKEALEYFGYVLEASQHMANLIEDLLKFSRLGKGNISNQRVSLKDILESVLKNLNHDITAHNARIIVKDKMPEIFSDETLLFQIFSNLVQNAIVYHRKGVDPEIAVSADDEEDKVIIKIKDNGQGIPEEHHEKIFNIFQRLHANDDVPGTGIGLAIVQKAVSVLKGSLLLESRVNIGTTFKVILPKKF